MTRTSRVARRRPRDGGSGGRFRSGTGRCGWTEGWRSDAGRSVDKRRGAGQLARELEHAGGVAAVGGAVQRAANADGAGGGRVVRVVPWAPRCREGGQRADRQPGPGAGRARADGAAGAVAEEGQVRGGRGRGGTGRRTGFKTPG